MLASKYNEWGNQRIHFCVINLYSFISPFVVLTGDSYDIRVSLIPKVLTRVLISEFVHGCCPAVARFLRVGVSFNKAAVG